jgi:poly [ADP-ribose] polymerase
MKERMDMLEMLADLEIAAGLLGDRRSVGPMNPLDAQYLQLATDLVPLEADSQPAQLVRSYVQNTHSTLHSDFGLEVEHVFAVQRSGEEEAFSKFQCLRNKRLLWHGSRLSNFAGIISQGLRIAPPEAPHSGYMFGKGIYFADMVSKSATYCHPHLSDNRILMLVSEVALGEVNEEAFGKYLTKQDLDSLGRHSTKGLGRLAPASTGDKVFDPRDDTVLPLGKEAATGVHSCELDHNEYIVYDTRQARQRFLVQLRYVAR